GRELDLIKEYTHELYSYDSECVVKDQLSLDLTNGFTISTWVQFIHQSGSKSNGDIMSVESSLFSSPLFSIWVEFPEGGIHFSCTQAENDTIKFIKTGVKAPEGAFHIAIEFDSMAFNLYLNGGKCKTIPETSPFPNPNNKVLVIGRSECTRDRNLSCTRQIFDIEIYSECLGEDDIKSIFAKAVNRHVPISRPKAILIEGEHHLDGNSAYGEDYSLPFDHDTAIFTPPTLVTRDFAHHNGVWSTEKHLRLAADIRNIGRADIVGFGMTTMLTCANDGKGRFESARVVLEKFPHYLGRQNSTHPRFFGDATGNGYPDIIAFGDSAVFISLNNRDGTFQPGVEVLRNLFCDTYAWYPEKHPRFVVDVTGNGVVDIAGFGEAGVYIAFNDGRGGFPSLKMVVSAFGYSEAAGSWRIEKHPRILADLTGKGHKDIIGFGETGVFVSKNNGNMAFSRAKLVLPNFGYAPDEYTGDGWRVNKHPRFVVDLTGNGKADIVGFGDGGVLVALNSGDGTFQPAEKVLDWFGFSDDAGGWRVEKHPRFVIDLTGDGCADIVGFHDDGVWVAFSNGDGTFQTPQRVVPDFGYDIGGWRVDKHPRILADLTGNGCPDIIGFGED
ncbi:13073_t:CDS:2, partial [Acaulospora colombiana]